MAYPRWIVLVVLMGGCLRNVGAQAPCYGFAPPVGITATPMPPKGQVFLDWDRDGDVDSFSAGFPFAVGSGLIPSSAPVPEFSIDHNDGTGVFTPKSWTLANANSTWWYGRAIAIGDFDGDGAFEVILPVTSPVVQSPGNPFPSGGVTLGARRLRDDRNGSFTDVGPVDIGLTYEPRTLRQTLDFDGDGDLDILGQRGIWTNDGTGSFAFASYGFPPSHTVSAAADVDGDGDFDLLGIDGSVKLYRNAGNGTFVVIPLPPTVTGLFQEFVDVDGDGDQDVFVGSIPLLQPGYFQIVENNGGSFTLRFQASLPAPWGAASASAGDVNGDGRTDLAILLVASPYSVASAQMLLYCATQWPFLYSPPGAFLTTGIQGLIDLDNDGDLDVGGSEARFNPRLDGLFTGFARQYGAGGAGSGGIVPLLGASGSHKPGFVSHLVVRNGLGGAAAVLAVGTGTGTLAGVPAPGLTVYNLPWIALGAVTLGGAPGQPGAGVLDAPIAVPPSLAYLTFYLQMAFADPAGPGGLTVSNALEVHYGS